MAQLTTKNIKVDSKNGEIKIDLSIELNINLKNDSVEVGVKEKVKEIPKEIEEQEWAIPDFSNSGIEFGKEVKEIK